MTALKGRRAVVTGGASGIGLATAALLLDRGASVSLLDIDEDGLQRAGREVGADTVVADVREAAEVERAVEQASSSLGGVIDLLVNAAGIYRFAPAIELEVTEWDDVVNTNLRGSWLVARAVARRLVDAGAPGTIVNISSTAGLVADRDEPSVHYDASKAGVIAITKQLAVELASHNVRVNAVCPGIIDTPMLRIFDSPEIGRRYVEQMVPAGRVGTPEEVAELIVFLSSEEAAYVIGVAVPIDGGVTVI